jgi:hypothetical protein
VKGRPCIRGEGEWIECAPSDATHLTLNIPGPSGELTLPIMIKGRREGTGKWTWNGDVDKPTLRPSLLTQGTRYLGGEAKDKSNWKAFRCHIWITDGQAIFLDDTDHEHKGMTLNLIELN